MISSRFTRLHGMLSALAAAAVLGGCLSDSPDSGSGSSSGDNNFSFETVIDVLGITQPTASVAGKLTTQEVEYDCWDDELVIDTLVDTMRYVVTGGSLYLWPSDEACVGQKLQGSSSTVFGTWTASTNFFFGMDSIPAAYRGDCEEIEEEDDDFGTIYDSLFQNLKVTYEISETKIKGKLSGRICMGQLVAASMTMDSQGFLSLQSSDCGSATIKNNLNNRTLKLSTSFKNDEVTVTYSSGGKKCTMVEPMELGNRAPTCPYDDGEEAQEEFEECLYSLPFFEDMEGALTKSASVSGPREVLKSVRKSLRAL